MTPLDHGSRVVIARDRMERFQAEADEDRLVATHADRSAGGWEGRPARQPPSDRVRALVGRLSRNLIPNPE